MFLFDDHWKLCTFSILNTETNFLKNEIFSKKLGYSFLVESTKIENVTFPNKSALSEASIKSTKLGKAKWSYPKEWSFASNPLLVFENLVSV